MKNTIAILGILFLAFLWAIPTFFVYHGIGHSKCGWFYFADLCLTAIWGHVLNEWYSK